MCSHQPDPWQTGRHLFNADAVGLQRGLKTILGALKFGQDSIQSSLHSQLKELKSDAAKSGGIAGGDSQNMYPSMFGYDPIGKVVYD